MQGFFSFLELRKVYSGIILFFSKQFYFQNRITIARDVGKDLGIVLSRP
jgi:hypothetical protein